MKYRITIYRGISIMIYIRIFLTESLITGYLFYAIIAAFMYRDQKGRIERAISI